MHRAAFVASSVARNVAAAAADQKPDEGLHPLRCCLMSLSLPWDTVARDLLFKVFDCKLYIPAGRSYLGCFPSYNVSWDDTTWRGSEQLISAIRMALHLTLKIIDPGVTKALRTTTRTAC